MVQKQKAIKQNIAALPWCMCTGEVSSLAERISLLAGAGVRHHLQLFIFQTIHGISSLHCDALRGHPYITYSLLGVSVDPPPHVICNHLDLPPKITKKYA